MGASSYRDDVVEESQESQEALAETTLHGLNHIVHGGSVVRRLCWAILLVAAFSGITWLVTDKVSTYYGTRRCSSYRGLLPMPAIHTEHPSRTVLL